jgi:hypothetical protein
MPVFPPFPPGPSRTDHLSRSPFVLTRVLRVDVKRREESEGRMEEREGRRGRDHDGSTRWLLRAEDELLDEIWSNCRS